MLSFLRLNLKYRFEEDGTKVRVAKKSGEVIPDPYKK
ncbi:hypothetical protein [Parolsenella catena]